MSTPQLKLVNPDDPIQKEIHAIADQMLESRKRSAEIVPPVGECYHDLANAERFLDAVGDDVIFCAERGGWMIWNGKHWTPDVENILHDLAKDFAVGLTRTATNDEARKNAKRACMRGGFKAFQDLAAADRTISISKFDADAFLLNCKNGTLDLRDGTLREHNRLDYITRIVNANFDPHAKCPTFDVFLEDIQPDPEVRAFLQRSIGYSLLGEVRERSFWILYGTGANGKSAFVNLFNNLLGEYACGTTSASIMAVRQPNGIPNDIARLKGKRFVIIPETEENERINAALIKALSAGDTVTARFLFNEFFDFQFTGKLWIATNHKPAITDHSKGFWDRLKIVPFNQRIAPEHQVKPDELMASLMDEADGILTWAVKGCSDYYGARGLKVPEVIQKEIDQYKFEQNPIEQFLEEYCETGEYFTVDNTPLFAKYREFALHELGYRQVSQKRFTQQLLLKGFTPGKSGRRFWNGLRLND
jgi:putative DNA primase/helicase